MKKKNPTNNMIIEYACINDAYIHNAIALKDPNDMHARAVPTTTTTATVIATTNKILKKCHHNNGQWNPLKMLKTMSTNNV